MNRTFVFYQSEDDPIDAIKDEIIRTPDEIRAYCKRRNLRGFWDAPDNDTLLDHCAISVQMSRANLTDENGHNFVNWLLGVK